MKKIIRLNWIISCIVILIAHQIIIYNFGLLKFKNLRVILMLVFGILLFTNIFRIKRELNERKPKSNESFLVRLFSFFLVPIFKFRIKKLINSKEYQADLLEAQEAQEQIRVSSEELKKNTEQIKIKIDEHEKLIKQMQSEGIDVTMASSTEEILNKTRDKHKDILNKYNIK
ncbi:MAG: hypothetical protein ACOYLP_07800 [Flavobacterium sp.]|uniref:hypothetical protein n=1 Tax=Flavobacterium sp. TaxID=239 RepID=UPI003BE26369